MKKIIFGFALIATALSANANEFENINSFQQLQPVCESIEAYGNKCYNELDVYGVDGLFKSGCRAHKKAMAKLSRIVEDIKMMPDSEKVFVSLNQLSYIRAAVRATNRVTVRLEILMPD